MIEKFNDMRDDLDRERKFMGKQWSKREAQILAVVGTMVGMVGDLQGITGKAMPEIPSCVSACNFGSDAILVQP